MRIPLLNATVMVAALGVASAASAEIIDFEDIGGFTDRANFPTLGIENTYRGYQWPTEGIEEFWAVVNNSDGQFGTVGAHNGQQAGWNWNDGGVRSIVFDVDKDVVGAWFNEFDAEQDWGADTVQFNGYDAGDVLVGTSGILSLDRDSANPAWQFLAAGFSGVRRLEIVSTNDRFSGEGWWAIDDLEIRDSQAAAPEPLTALLFGVGLAGIGWRARATKTRT